MKKFSLPKILRKSKEQTAEANGAPDMDSNGSASKWPKILMSMLVILSISGIIWGFFLVKQHTLKKKVLKAQQAQETAQEQQAVPVKGYKTKRTYFKDILPAMGSIKGYKEIDLKFEATGVIESINFEEGESVSEGDIIANLVQKDALLKIKYTTLQHEKNKRIFELGGLDETRFKQSELELESAKSDFEKTNLYAPVPGFIGRIYLEEGELVSQNDKVCILVELGKVYCELGIIEKDSAKISLGQKVEAYIDAIPGKTYEGKVDVISPMVEGRSRTQSIRIKIDNSSLELKPGMFARANIYTYEKKDALIVPSTALEKEQNQYFVYVINQVESKPAEKDNFAQEKTAATTQDDLKQQFTALQENQKQGEDAQNQLKEGNAAELKPEGPKEGMAEKRFVSVAYIAPDFSEIEEGLEEGEIVVVEKLQGELADKAKVEILEVQEQAAE